MDDVLAWVVWVACLRRWDGWCACVGGVGSVLAWMACLCGWHGWLRGWRGSVDDMPAWVTCVVCQRG